MILTGSGPPPSGLRPDPSASRQEGVWNAVSGAGAGFHWQTRRRGATRLRRQAGWLADQGAVAVTDLLFVGGTLAVFTTLVALVRALARL